MGNSDMDKLLKDKESKTPPSNSQEQASTTTSGTVNPEWSGFQAYSPIPPHGFLASNQQAHPYMWGVQHIMPPYGTPPHPYVAMYPPGGLYAHPSIPPGSYPFSPFAMPTPNGILDASGTTTPGSMEADAKPQEVKEKLPIKRSKGSLGSLNMITGKNSELVKTSGTSANGIHSKSGESCNEGSSEGNDSSTQNDSQHNSGGRQDSLEESGQNGNSVHGSQNGLPNTPHPHPLTNQTMNVMAMTAPGGAPGSVSGPTTNLNIGMEYWGTPTTSAIPAICGKVPSTPVAGAIVTAGSLDSSQPWMQDERELKRQRRKQSNRESARRSRLRKQAECDELAQRAEMLKDENAALRSEVNQIRSEYAQLLADNASLKERLGEAPSNEDLRPGGNEQQLSNDAQETGKTEVVKDGA